MSAEEFKEHMARLAELLERCPPIMAVHADYPEQVFGWICSEMQDGNQVLHFAYVRKPFRQLGIASRLFEKAFPKLKACPVFYTHPSRSVNYHRDRWVLKFNPYLVK